MLQCGVRRNKAAIKSNTKTSLKQLVPIKGTLFLPKKSLQKLKLLRSFSREATEVKGEQPLQGFQRDSVPLVAPQSETLPPRLSTRYELS